MSLPTVTDVQPYMTSKGKMCANPGGDTSYRWKVTLSHSDPYGWLVAMYASGIFRRSDVDIYTGLCCTDVSSEPDSSDPTGINYLVTCMMGDDPIAASAFLPWQRKDKVDESCKRYQVPMEHDYSVDGSGNPKPVVNSAFDRPATPIMHEAINPFYRVRRCRLAADFDYAAAKSAQDSINKYDVTISEITGNITIAAGEGRLHSVVATPAVFYDPTGSGVTAYYDVVMEIEGKGQYPPPTGNLAKVRVNDMGFNCFTSSTNDGSGLATPITTPPAGKKIRMWQPVPDTLNPGSWMTDTRGNIVQQPMTTAQFLNSDGTRFVIDPASSTLNADLLSKVKDFVRFPTVDWSSFAT